MRTSGLTSTIELILGILICAKYGRSPIIGSIVVCALRLFFILGFAIHHSSKDKERMLLNTAALYLLSIADIIFTSYFYATFVAVAVDGISACTAYSNNTNALSYTGDANYFQDAKQCASGSSGSPWTCFCFNNVDGRCYTFPSQQHHLNSASEADESCGGLIDSRSAAYTALSITLIVMSVLHFVWYLIAMIRVYTLPVK